LAAGRSRQLRLYVTYGPRPVQVIRRHA